MTPQNCPKRKSILVFIGFLLLNLNVYAQTTELDLQFINKQNQPSLSTSQQETSTKRVLVFVSSSMPDESLKQWFTQAQNIHAPVILRGLVQNSLPATKQWLSNIAGENVSSYGVQINPAAFEQYDIQQVPAVVVTSKTTTCPVNMSCPSPSFVEWGLKIFPVFEM